MPSTAIIISRFPEKSPLVSRYYRMEMNGISGQASNKNGSLNNIMNQALRSLRLKLSAVRNAEVAKRPLILQLGKTADRKVLSALMRQRAVRQVSDDYPEQLRELF